MSETTEQTDIEGMKRDITSPDPLVAMLDADQDLYEQALDTPGFAYHFNRMARAIAHCKALIARVKGLEKRVRKLQGDGPTSLVGKGFHEAAMATKDARIAELESIVAKLENELEAHRTSGMGEHKAGNCGSLCPWCRAAELESAFADGSRLSDWMRWMTTADGTLLFTGEQVFHPDVAEYEGTLRIWPHVLLDNDDPRLCDEIGALAERRGLEVDDLPVMAWCQTDEGYHVCRFVDECYSTESAAREAMQKGGA